MVATLFGGVRMQLSKTIYFHDYPTASGARSGLTVPFSETEAETFRVIQPLSSYTLRQLIGFENYTDLERAAEYAASPVATFARGILKKNAPKDSLAFTENRAGLQATFRGGKGSPLHDWYPYLEGYSPEFVASVLRQFAPEYRVVCDPFCGSGTTALVAALQGKIGLYAEVNPVCRFVIESKAIALALNEREKLRLAEQLISISAQLSQKLNSSRPDRKLPVTFAGTFGERPFFEKESFDAVLRARSLADALVEQDSFLGRFFTVAALRSLVPASLLVRRGDLRFRTAAELTSSAPSFAGELRESLRVIASDLVDTESAPGSVRFIGEDARELAQRLDTDIDAVVTSPPYLNGTNYFRNTKIELWFLRHLATKADLRKFRDKAITAGINDVTIEKSGLGSTAALPAQVLSVIAALEDSAYDQRIPLMVRSYFTEMQTVIRTLRAISNPTTVVAIDLGDSCYGDVWVPTHDIICRLMEERGFIRTDNVVLRERQSRDGRKLSQTLQVFALKPASRAVSKRSSGAAPGPSFAIPTKWKTFRDELPHQSGEMAKRNWGHSWHSLCSYQGKLKPSIAHSLVDALMPRKPGKLLDPFSGVGTIPFEARLRGHTAFGFDISPAAVAISRAKLEPVTKTGVRKVLRELSEWLDEYKVSARERKATEVIRFNGPLADYFHPATFNEILAARAFFSLRPANDGNSALVLSSLLHVLHGNRPYALSRRSHPITPFSPTGAFEYRGLIGRVEAKVERTLRDQAKLSARGKCYHQDATGEWPSEVSELDAIVTSPPFFDSTRFHTANWMRLWMAGWEASDFALQPKEFLDERQKAGFAVYKSIFRQAADRLKVGGFLAVHLGKSKKCDMAAGLTDIGQEHLFLVDSFAESVEHCESHGIRDKGTVTHHQYLLFRRR